MPAIGPFANRRTSPLPTATVSGMSPMQPLGIGGVLDRAVGLYRERFGTLATVAAAVLVPAGVAQALIAVEAGTIDLTPLLDPVSPVLPAEFERFLGLSLASIVVATVASLLVQASAVHVLAAEYEDREVAWSTALGRGLRRAVPVVTVGILLALGAGIGAMALLIPGVWLWTSWYVAVPALVLERTTPVAALTRSFRLVRQHFWPVLGVALLATAVAALASYTAGTVVALLTPEDATLTAAVGSLAGTVAAILTTPFTAAIATATYVDLRVRAEGYTLDLLSADLGRLHPA